MVAYRWKKVNSHLYLVLDTEESSVAVSPVGSRIWGDELHADEPVRWDDDLVIWILLLARGFDLFT